MFPIIMSELQNAIAIQARFVIIRIMESQPDESKIALHQFVICENFSTLADDGYIAKGIRSNLYVSAFPCSLDPLYVVTCWRKDTRFHKEVIEYAVGSEILHRTAHMDIEPVTNHVIFRWHTHRFPPELSLAGPVLLTVRVVLDWNKQFESYLLIEKRP